MITGRSGISKQIGHSTAPILYKIIIIIVIYDYYYDYYYIIIIVIIIVIIIIIIKNIINIIPAIILIKAIILLASHICREISNCLYQLSKYLTTHVRKYVNK